MPVAPGTAQLGWIIMKRFIIAPLLFLGILIFFGCATDESRFDDSFTNDAFQKIIAEDGVSEGHIMGEDSNRYSTPQQGHNQNQHRQRRAPSQPRQGYSSSQGGTGAGMIGDSIPMDPNH